MNETEARRVVERYLQALNEQNFDLVQELFADDVLIEWPQSGERFHGKVACLNVFKNYPGGSPRPEGEPRVLGGGNVWVSEITLRYPDQKQYFTVGIVELKDGKVAHEIDYFAEPFPAPEWRKQWVSAE